MSLISEIKRRQKQAQLGELGVRALSELGETAAERATINSEAAGVRVPAMNIRPIVESRISDLTAKLVKQRRIPPGRAEDYSKNLLKQLEPEIQKREQQAFRTESGERVTAPATLSSTGGAMATMTGFNWLLERAPWLIGKRPVNPPTLGQSFKSIFLPAFLPITAGFEAVNHLVAPKSDPLRQRGERGYWKSVGESFKGAREGLADHAAETRARYGLFGVPIQMFHGIMNPLASMGYLGQQVGELFKKPDIKGWAQEAAARREAEYGQ